MTVGTFFSEQDTYIRGGANANNNYSGDGLIAIKEAGVGNESFDRAGLVSFNLSGIPVDATVNTVSFSAVSSGGGNGASTVRFFECLRDWIDTEATFNSYSLGNSWAVAGCRGDTTDMEGDFAGDSGADAFGTWTTGSESAGDAILFSSNSNLTTYVSGILGGTANFVFHQNEGDNKNANFYDNSVAIGSRPKLTIDYTEAVGGTNAEATPAKETVSLLTNVVATLIMNSAVATATKIAVSVVANNVTPLVSKSAFVTATKIEVSVLANTATISTSGGGVATPAKSVITVAVNAPTIVISNSAFVTATKIEVSVLANTVTVSTSGSTVATPSKSEITVAVNAPTLVISKSAVATAKGKIEVSVLANSVTTNITKSATIAVSVANITVAVNTASTSTGGSATATPAVATVTITINSATANVSESRVVSPEVVSITITTFVATGAQSGQTSGIVVHIVLKSEIEKQPAYASRIEKYFPKKSRIDKFFAEDSEMKKDLVLESDLRSTD